MDSLRGTHSAVRANHVVGGVSLTLSSPSPAPVTEAELLKPDSSVVLILWLAIRVVVWACSNGLGTNSGKDRGSVAGSLAHLEAGHGVISCGDEVAE